MKSAVTPLVLTPFVPFRLVPTGGLGGAGAASRSGPMRAMMSKPSNRNGNRNGNISSNGNGNSNSNGNSNAHA